MRMRVNISIPDDLKKRMDAHDGVNWSSVAQLAFEAKLASIARDKKKENEMSIDISAIASRLKATKLPENIEQSKAEIAGRRAGTAWASESAALAQIERLPNLTGVFAGEPMAPFTRSDLLYGEIFEIDFEDDDFDHDELQKKSIAFFEDLIVKASDSRYIGDEDFSVGFFEAACDVYSAVRDKI
jgi:hypothetical protein